MDKTEPRENYIGDEAPTGEHPTSHLSKRARSDEPKEPGNVFTVPELAARWDVNVKTIYGMIDRGELAVLRLGRVIRIARSVIESWESQGRVASPGE